MDMPHGSRFGAALRSGVILAAVLLVAGCSEVSSGGDGADGSPGVHVTDGRDGGAANGGKGGDGVDGRDGADGADGADGSPGLNYSDPDAVSGSGHLTSRLLSFSGVTKLDVGANFVVHLTIGKPEQATIRMDDNLTDLVEATVVGDHLRLGLKPGANVRNATLSAEVTVASLDRLNAHGASEVRLGSEVAGEQMQVHASGASRVTGAVRVDHALASASGASTLELSGDVGHLDLSGSGTSGLRLPDLTVRDLDVELSGASCATLTVRDTLTARAAGVSALRYSGAPRINRDDISGLSSIAPDDPGSPGCGA